MVPVVHEALDGLAEGGHALEDATLDGSALQLRSAASSNPISAGERARPWPTGTWLTTTALNRYALFRRWHVGILVVTEVAYSTTGAARRHTP